MLSLSLDAVEIVHRGFVETKAVASRAHFGFDPNGEAVSFFISTGLSSSDLNIFLIESLSLALFHHLLLGSLGFIYIPTLPGQLRLQKLAERFVQLRKLADYGYRRPDRLSPS
ncbi:hypothetical protein ONZ45_g16315 [Pleurotus djamor]|nr:hypothetical protein ONZ45_g16315 [Pleurotus djamor]